MNQLIKQAMKDHKQKIELIQWGIISGISSLIYSEYIKNIRQKQIPVRMVQIPSIKSVKRFLDPEFGFLQDLSYKFIDNIYNHKLFQKYHTAPEFILFNDENIEILKTIFDLYIIPNISRRIPEVIVRKFDLDNPKQQLFRESNEIDLFQGKLLNDEQYEFVVEESILQMLLLLPTMKKDIELIEDNSQIHLAEDEILTIGNEKAICPILLNDSIIRNESVIDLLKFVTSTEISYIGKEDERALKGDRQIEYFIKTNPFNQICITRLDGIETSSQ